LPILGLLSFGPKSKIDESSSRIEKKINVWEEPTTNVKSTGGNGQMIGWILSY